MTASFAASVLSWFDHSGRTHLPWQQNPTPYRVWISEIMLQQTQVTTVIPYYQRFMQSFPDIKSLADASTDAVLKHWEGLGYYTRARNLHKTAQLTRDQYANEFPTTLAEVEALPGIGRSTAGAILSLACNQAHPILDGNVKRVLARYHALEGYPGQSAVQKQLWAYAEQHLPTQRNAAYTQAMMDLGATLCTRSQPACLLCPLQTGCQALKQGKPTAYPTPRPAKVLAQKHAVTLLIRNNKGEFALEQRPPTGIWGGLWSFPEFPDQASALASLNTQPLAISTLATLTHGFSHFTLHLTPLLVDVQDLQTATHRIMDRDSWLWYKAGTEFSGGLSSAAQRLLKNLTEEI
ncbi:A/G-specific adenine glycosylase [Thiothrix eikelboomii]|uniref:A/G-specific adenine glycosylase n=1 Tax=Thiothrix eikelboomii TaxID=92487 RepID=UPI003BAF0117